MMKHYHRGLTVFRHRHPTWVVRDDESVPSGDVGGAQESQAPAASHRMPMSTTVAIIVLAVVGFLAIVLIARWVYRSRKFRSNKLKRTISPPLNAKHVNLDVASDISEPKRAFIGGTADGTSLWRHAEDDDDKYKDVETFEPLCGWAPELKSTTSNITVPKPSLKKEPLKKEPSKKSFKIQQRLSRLGVPPPPSYSAAFAGIGGIDKEMMAMKYPVPSSRPDPTPDTRMEARPPVVSTTFKMEASAGRPSRTSSCIKLGLSTPNNVNNSSQTSPTSASASIPPKLMTVINTFTPTLDDELPLTIGDTVRMLEEYKDGWCVVQYLGQHKAVKGAVPRFCLQERNAVSSRKFF